MRSRTASAPCSGSRQWLVTGCDCEGRNKHKRSGTAGSGPHHQNGRHARCKRWTCWQCRLEQHGQQSRQQHRWPFSIAPATNTSAARCCALSPPWVSCHSCSASSRFICRRCPSVRRCRCQKAVGYTSVRTACYVPAGRGASAQRWCTFLDAAVCGDISAGSCQCAGTLRPVQLQNGGSSSASPVLWASTVQPRSDKRSKRTSLEALPFCRQRRGTQGCQRSDLLAIREAVA